MATWTNTTRRTTNTLITGTPVGLLLAITYANTIPGQTEWTNDSRNTSTWTNSNRNSTTWTNTNRT